MHQLFFHAWESIRFSTLPLSFFSEQSIESSNKFFKSDREHHARKDTRLHTIQDQFHRQSDKSDLVIALKLSEKQKKKKKTTESLPPDVRHLLVASEAIDEDWGIIDIPSTQMALFRATKFSKKNVIEIKKNPGNELGVTCCGNSHLWLGRAKYRDRQEI